ESRRPFGAGWIVNAKSILTLAASTHNNEFRCLVKVLCYGVCYKARNALGGRMRGYGAVMGGGWGASAAVGSRSNCFARSPARTTFTLPGAAHGAPVTHS